MLHCSKKLMILAFKIIHKFYQFWSILFCI